MNRRDVLKTMAALPLAGLSSTVFAEPKKSILERLRGKAWGINHQTGRWDRDIADVLADVPLRTIGGGFGDFLKNIGRLQSPTLPSAETEGSGFTQGFLLKPEHEEKLLEEASKESVLYKHCKVVKMKKRQEIFAQIYSNLDTYCAVEMVARDNVGMFLASEELSKEPDLLDIVTTTLFSQSIGWSYDYNGLQGHGNHQPLGILNSPALLKVTKGVTLEESAGKMIAAFHPYCLKDAKWFTHPNNFPEILTLNEHWCRINEKGI